MCLWDPTTLPDHLTLPLFESHSWVSTGGLTRTQTPLSATQDDWFASYQDSDMGGVIPPGQHIADLSAVRPIFVQNSLVATLAAPLASPPPLGGGPGLLPSPYAQGTDVPFPTPSPGAQPRTPAELPLCPEEPSHVFAGGKAVAQGSGPSPLLRGEVEALLRLTATPQHPPAAEEAAGHIPLLHHCLNLLIRQQTAEEVLQARVAERTRELTEERRRLEAEIAIRAQKEAELDRLAQSLEAQVQQRTRELEAALAQAERSSKYKSSFLAQMSHEIRTPLGGVVTTSALLAETDLDPAQRELVDGHQRRAGLREDLSHRLTLTYAAMDPTSASEATQCVTGLIQARSLRLAVEADPALPHLVLADRTRLRQILVNLLSNAAKFTPPEGRIVVRARVVSDGSPPSGVTLHRADDDDNDDDEDQAPHEETRAPSASDGALSPQSSREKRCIPWDIQVLRDEEEVRAQGGPEEAGRITSDDLAPDRASLQVGEGRPPMALKTIEFSVSDTGCGVPRRLHRFIFRRFRQVLTHSSASRQPGTGLGLSISRNLATGMGGGIGLDSAPEEGRLGSTFTFTIRALVPADAAQPQLAQPDPAPAPACPAPAAGVSASAQVASPDMGPATFPQAGSPGGSCSADPSPPSPLIPGLGSAAQAQQPQSGSDGGAGGAAPAGMRVVLVEDNPVNQRVAQLVLGRLNQRPVAVFEHGLLLLQALGVPAQAAQASGGSCEPLGDSDDPAGPAETLAICRTPKARAAGPPTWASEAPSASLCFAEERLGAQPPVARTLFPSPRPRSPASPSAVPASPPAPIALGPEAGPLVVLLDLSMPVMDGFTTAAHVMQHFPDPATRPILVALTGRHLSACISSAVSERQRCLAAGFDFFITKPFSPATLKTLLLQNVPALIRRRQQQPPLPSSGPQPAAQPPPVGDGPATAAAAAAAAVAAAVAVAAAASVAEAQPSRAERNQSPPPEAAPSSPALPSGACPQRPRRRP
ncbi:putative sensory histidine protein kinase [Paratrimastix pyriformis]|uniref:histidine kinase n=1 Tax=Paratrimastix pyriformis TaxID=342808 RepID=A0ABQ8UYN7_9EUKA|nr:putative sensory histidine protein kinase [Paratrimastix pyriformis]